jgi:hypothetical protein
LLALLLQLMEDESTFRERLDDEERRRRDRRLPRASLLLPCDSPWERLFMSANDQALITINGFDHEAFNGMLELFSPWFDAHTPWTRDGSAFERLTGRSQGRGRARIINAAACLGLVLAWYTDSEALSTFFRVGLGSQVLMPILGSDSEDWVC